MVIYNKIFVFFSFFLGPVVSKRVQIKWWINRKYKTRDPRIVRSFKSCRIVEESDSMYTCKILNIKTVQIQTMNFM